MFGLSGFRIGVLGVHGSKVLGFGLKVMSFGEEGGFLAILAYA